MPYYPEDQSDKNLEKIRRNNVCAVCDRQLYVFLDIKTKQKYIACPTPGHEGIAREYKSQSIDYQSTIRRETELEEKHGPGTTVALRGLPKHGQLTQPQAEHILSLVYPGCPRDEIIRCAILCRDFGLHPLMKEVYLIPFKEKSGKENYATVLGINATRKLMSQRGTYSYFDDTPRLMTEEEQMRIFGEVDGKNLVAITKLRTKDGLEAPGYGRWPKDKEPYGTDKGNTKANMAFIRSERNAFSRLSPDALPPDIDIIDEAYAEVPDIGKVVVATGEIFEGESREIAPGEEEPPVGGTEIPPTQPELTPGELAQEVKDRAVTGKEVYDLRVALKDHGKDLAWVGAFCRSEERKWEVRDLKDLKVSQLSEIYKELNKAMIP